MHSRASKALHDAFLVRGVQAKLAYRTKISQSRLSRLATDAGTIPRLGILQKLAADPDLPIPIGWWEEPARVRRARPKRKAA